MNQLGSKFITRWEKYSQLALLGATFAMIPPMLYARYKGFSRKDNKGSGFTPSHLGDILGAIDPDEVKTIELRSKNEERTTQH